jgi:transposase
MEQLVMNRKERERLVVFSRVKDRELSRKAGAQVLAISLRQMHRVYLRYQAEGDKGLVHRARGKPSVKKINSSQREKAMELYRSTYRGFGPTLLAEKLSTDHGIWASHDTVRRWLIGEGLLERCRKGRRSRRRRVRKEKFGQMVQMDGSHHRWFEDRGGKCCLMVMIDDATGQVRARFYEQETLLAAMETFGRWCGEFGIPQSLYVDRAGIYRADREPTLNEITSGKPPVTQFGRAMKELNVRLILARSPQAKGRVERANGTLQDRLVKEMRLAGIGSIEQANRWLDQSRFFQTHSDQFAVKPVDANDAHRPVVIDLGCVLCVKEKRSVSLDSCLQWQGQTLQLKDARASLRQVELWQQIDGTLLINDGGRRLSFTPWTAPPRVRKIVKNNRVHKPTARQQIRLPGSHPPRKTEPAGSLK